MIDISAIQYDIYAVTANGTKICLTNAVTRAGWEENKNEISVRANLTIVDNELEGKLLSEWLPLCTRIYIMADWGNGFTEIFRGSIWQIEPPGTRHDPTVITAYDELYYCQKSDDSCYFASGTSTQTVIEKKLGEWEIPIGEYKGPTVKHNKLVYKSKALATIFTELLKDAHENGGPECLIRMAGGKAYIVPYCSNAPIYLFEGDNTLSIKQTNSMTEMVTKVVVFGKAAKSGKQKIEATLLGKTEYGIIQRTYDRNSESLKKAKVAAQKILDDDGEPKKTVNLQAPDLPFLRKGDKIYVRVGMFDGYAKVLGVSHDINSASMQMEVEAFTDTEIDTQQEAEAEAAKLPTLKKGDFGPDVTRMQKLLIGKGFGLPKNGADGVFGSETQSALKKFQKKNSLKANGVCNAATWTKLLI